MTTCEEMVSRPSPNQPGWVQWGTVNDLGEFSPLYGVEDHHDQSSSLYFAAAAGVCEIKGQYALGQPAPVPPPTVVPTAPETPSTTEEPPVTDAQFVPEVSVTEQPIEPVVNPAAAWVESALPIWIAGGLAILVMGTAWSKQRRKTTDPTPNTKAINPFAPKDGD
jgi:hypothetical protein